jgi:hypothetical protein
MDEDKGKFLVGKNCFDRCPKCFERIGGYYNNIIIPNHADRVDFYSIAIYFTNCDWCKTLILYKADHHPYYTKYENQLMVTEDFQGCIKDNVSLIFPEKTPTKLSSDIPTEYAVDFYEAQKVLEISPKSSAALSRRCLQKLLENKAQVKKGDLSREIQDVIDSGKLPTDLSDSIDAIRNIGNFAAHPLKSTDTGEIVDVEIGEAEWTLNILKELLDFYIVRPAELQRKRDDLNTKLSNHGKPNMK